MQLRKKRSLFTTSSKQYTDDRTLSRDVNGQACHDFNAKIGNKNNNNNNNSADSMNFADFSVRKEMVFRRTSFPPSNDLKKTLRRIT